MIYVLIAADHEDGIPVKFDANHDPGMRCIGKVFVGLVDGEICVLQKCRGFCVASYGWYKIMSKISKIT